MANAGKVMRSEPSPAPVKLDPALVREFREISSSGGGPAAEGRTPAFNRAGFKKFASTTGRLALGVFRKEPAAPSGIKGDTYRVNLLANRLSVENPTRPEGQLLALVLERARQDNA